MLLNLCIKGIDCASVSPPSGIGDLGPYLLSRLGPLVVLLPNWLSISTYLMKVIPETPRTS
jgi:hypothetical protein